MAPISQIKPVARSPIVKVRDRPLSKKSGKTGKIGNKNRSQKPTATKKISGRNIISQFARQKAAGAIKNSAFQKTLQESPLTAKINRLANPLSARRDVINIKRSKITDLRINDSRKRPANRKIAIAAKIPRSIKKPQNLRINLEKKIVRTGLSPGLDLKI